MERLVRVGIVSDTPLQGHLLATEVADMGYDIAVNTSPNGLNKSLLKSDAVSMWIVNLEMAEEWSEFLDSLLDQDQASIIFGEGAAPKRTSEQFPKWQRRLKNKLLETAPPISEAKTAPVFDLEKLQDLQPDQEQALELPTLYHYANPTQVDQVWVIGSSLGGPEPVKTFFDALPKEIPAAFIYAQHIDEGCLDALVVSIGRHARLTMELAGAGKQLENGKILVAPVSNEIDFHANNSVMTKDEPWSGPYGPSIDQLMKNVSSRYGKKANAIIFSGMGSDGSLGATLIKEAGGLVWSQSTETCTQPSMPDSADETGCVSFRGSARDLAKQLLSHIVDSNGKTSKIKQTKQTKQRVGDS